MNAYRAPHVCRCGHFRVQHASACRECDCEGFEVAELAPVGRVIEAARAVAATEEAQELARRTGGKHGTWTARDEENLRAGFVKTPAGDFLITEERR